MISFHVNIWLLCHSVNEELLMIQLEAIFCEDDNLL